MNERYIAMSLHRKGFGGCWGAGKTAEEAKRNLHKEGGTPKNCAVTRFKSELPFAPHNREATEGEADAYVSRDGTLCWVRCEREQVEEVTA